MKTYLFLAVFYSSTSFSQVATGGNKTIEVTPTIRQESPIPGGGADANAEEVKCKMMAKTGQGNDNENRPKISAKIVRHYVA